MGKFRILVIDNQGPGVTSPVFEKFREYAERQKLNNLDVEAVRCADKLDALDGVFAERMKKLCNLFDLAVVLPDKKAEHQSSSTESRMWIHAGFWIGRRAKMAHLDSHPEAQVRARTRTSSVTSLLVFGPRPDSVPSNRFGTPVPRYPGAAGAFKRVRETVAKWKQKVPRIPTATIQLVRDEIAATRDWPEHSFLESGYTTGRRPCDLTLQALRLMSLGRRFEKCIHAHSELHTALRKLLRDLRRMDELMAKVIFHPPDDEQAVHRAHELSKKALVVAGNIKRVRTILVERGPDLGANSRGHWVALERFLAKIGVNDSKGLQNKLRKLHERASRFENYTPRAGTPTKTDRSFRRVFVEVIHPLTLAVRNSEDYLRKGELFLSRGLGQGFDSVGDCRPCDFLTVMRESAAELEQQFTAFRPCA